MNRIFRLSVALGTAIVAAAWGAVLWRLASTPAVARTATATAMANCRCNSDCVIVGSDHYTGGFSDEYDTVEIYYTFNCSFEDLSDGPGQCLYEIDCDLYQFVDGSYEWYDSKSTGSDNPIHLACWTDDGSLFPGPTTGQLNSRQSFSWRGLPDGQYRATFTVFTTNPDGTWDYVAGCDGSSVYFTRGLSLE